MSVCSTCGVPVTAARSGRLVHLDDIPQGVPEHDITVMAASDFARAEDRRFTLKGAAEDMLAHHAALHPAAECEWAAVLRHALESA